MNESDSNTDYPNEVDDFVTEEELDDILANCGTTQETETIAKDLQEEVGEKQEKEELLDDQTTVTPPKKASIFGRLKGIFNLAPQ